MRPPTTRAPLRSGRSIPCRHDPGRDGGRSRRSPGRGSRTGASTPPVLAVVAIAAPAPALLRRPVARVRRRRVRVVGAGDARRRGAVPRHLLEPGPGVPPAACGSPTSSGSARWTRRGCSPSPPACSLTDRGLLVRTPASRRARNALLAAGLVTTSGSVLWVTGPVNADGPSLALSVLAVAFALALPRRPAPARPRCGSGSPAGAAVSIKALSVPAVVDRRADRAAARTGDASRDAAVAAGVALAVYVVAALPFGHRPGVGPVVHVPPGRPPGEHATAARSRKILDTLWDRDLLVVARARCSPAIAFVVRFVAAPAPAGRARRPGARRSSSPGSCSGSCSCSRCSCGSRRCGARTSPTSCRRSRCSPRSGPPPWPVLAVAALVAAPFCVVEQPVDPLARRLHRPRGRAGAPPRALPVRRAGDQRRPGLVWRAGHGPPGDFADTSFQRIDQRRDHRRRRW